MNEYTFSRQGVSSKAIKKKPRKISNKVNRKINYEKKLYFVMPTVQLLRLKGLIKLLVPLD